MKRRLLAVFIALIPLSLTSCSLLSWNNLNTPAKFLKHAESDYGRCWISLPGYDSSSNSGKDYGLEVKKALVDAGGFKKTDQSQPETYRYFEYGIRYKDGYVGLASGLNCIMSIYDDGFIKIEYQTYEKDNKYAYFTMDPEKACEITDLVYEKIPRDKQTIAEDKTQAYTDGGVDNFIAAMEKKSSIKVSLVEYSSDKTTKANYNLTDNGELLKLIKDAEYTRTVKSANWDASRVLTYNLYTYQKDELNWNYYLYDSFDFVDIYYSYKNRLKENNNVAISYNIDPVKGKAIYDKALGMATAKK